MQFTVPVVLESANDARKIGAFIPDPRHISPHKLRKNCDCILQTTFRDKFNPSREQFLTYRFSQGAEGFQNAVIQLAM